MSGIVRTVAQVGAVALGTSIGGPVGGAIGNVLFNLAFPMGSSASTATTQLSDLMREGADYGSPIKQFFGVMPTKGDVIDCGVDADGVPAGIEEVITEQKVKRGTGKGPKQADTQKEYTYYMTCAFLLGEGPLYVDQMIIEDASGDHVIYDRYAAGMPTPPSPNATEATLNAWHNYWNAIQAQEAPYVQGTGLKFTPEYEGGELIAELSQTVRMYPGTERQKKDTALQLIHGEKTCAYRGRSYVMFNRYGPLDGSTSVRFIVRNPVTGRREIIIKRLGDAGVSTSRILLNSIGGTVYGAAVTQVEPARNLCESIAASTFHDLIFINGAFRDASRLNPATWTIPKGKLGAYILNKGSGDFPDKTKIEVKHEKEMPSGVRIKFIDIDLNGEENEAVANRNSAQYENEILIQLPIAARLDDISRLADIVLDELWSQVGSEQIALLPSFIQIAQGNVVNYFDDDGNIRSIRIGGQQLGTVGPLEMTGVPYDAGVYGIHRIVVGQERPRNEATVYVAPNFYVGDLPVFDESYENKIGFVVGASTPNGSGWSGAVLESEGTNGIGNTSLPFKSITGKIVNAFSYNESHIGQFNEEMTIRVELDGFGELRSTTPSLASQDANLLAIGDLLVTFLDAEPVEENVFDLTGIMPGRYGTDWIQELPEDTKIMLIRDDMGDMSGGMAFVEVPTGLINKPIPFEVYSSGDPTATTGAQSITVAGNTIKPPRPSIIKMNNSEGGLSVWVFPKTRAWESSETSWFTGLHPRETDPRKVTVVLKNGVTVVDTRTVTSVDLPVKIDYTNAELVTWYGEVPEVLTGSVYHEGVLTRGQERQFAI